MTFEEWLSANYYKSGRWYYKFYSKVNNGYTLEQLRGKFGKG